MGLEAKGIVHDLLAGASQVKKSRVEEQKIEQTESTQVFRPLSTMGSPPLVARLQRHTSGATGGDMSRATKTEQSPYLRVRAWTGIPPLPSRRPWVGGS